MQKFFFTFNIIKIIILKEKDKKIILCKAKSFNKGPKNSNGYNIFTITCVVGKRRLIEKQNTKDITPGIVCSAKTSEGRQGQI